MAIVPGRTPDSVALGDARTAFNVERAAVSHVPQARRETRIETGWETPSVAAWCRVR